MPFILHQPSGFLVLTAFALAELTLIDRRQHVFGYCCCRLAVCVSKRLLPQPHSNLNLPLLLEVMSNHLRSQPFWNGKQSACCFLFLSLRDLWDVPGGTTKHDSLLNMKRKPWACSAVEGVLWVSISTRCHVSESSRFLPSVSPEIYQSIPTNWIFSFYKIANCFNFKPHFVNIQMLKQPVDFCCLLFSTFYKITVFWQL